MADPFLPYETIDARQIVKSNIRFKHSRRDLASLLKAVDALRSLSSSENDFDEGYRLERQIIRDLDGKPDLLDLLQYYGFERNSSGEYAYRSTQSNREKRRRKSGMDDVEKLSRDLRKAQKGSLDGFEDFIRGRISQGDFHSSTTDKEEEQSLPDARDIRNGNAATIALVKLLKESLVVEHDVNPSHHFVRRRIARLAYKQNYPEARRVNDDFVDIGIDRKTTSLKEKDRQSSTPRSNYVYQECLIRTNFDETEALDMVQKNPPNLEIPVQQAAPQTSGRPVLDSVMEPLKQCARLVNQQNNNERLAQQMSHVDDRWNSVAYLVPAIQQLRQKCPGDTANDAVFSQMYRLLYSELVPRFGPGMTIKIEMFAKTVCDFSFDRIENLDVTTLKTYLSSTSGSQINDTFIENAGRLISIQCPTCVEFFPHHQIETMYLCDHQCCLGCLKVHYRTAINGIKDSSSLNTLTCFMEQIEITDDVYMNFFQYLEGKLRVWFRDEPDVLQKFHDKTFYAARGTQVKNCGSSKCTSSFYVEENAAIARVRCPHCDFPQCPHCCLQWNDAHRGKTCDEFRTWLIANDPNNPDLLALKAVGSNAIVCPTCQNIYEYEAGGCEHFTCQSCKTAFCRMCSGLFYIPGKTLCPLKNCGLNSAIHAHCKPNCFRELRDGDIEAMVDLLEENEIDVSEGLEQKPVPLNRICSVNGCKSQTTADSGNRMCERCYKHFLCSLIWTHNIEPWEIYQDNNLSQILNKSSIKIPPDATREVLIELCQEHLNGSLGKPKPLTMPTVL